MNYGVCLVRSQRSYIIVLCSEVILYICIGGVLKVHACRYEWIFETRDAQFTANIMSRSIVWMDC